MSEYTQGEHLQAEELVDISEENITISGKPVDRKLRFLMAQVVICVIVICYLLILRTFGGELYKYSRAVFDFNFNTRVNTEQVLTDEEARKIIAAHSTAFIPASAPATPVAKGGYDDEGDAFLHDTDEISDDVSQRIENSDINSMQMPVYGVVTSLYGYRRHPVTGERAFHAGLDIAADTGTAIKAALPGVVRVAYSGESSSYGKFVVIEHSTGVETLYAHCSEVLVGVGEYVEKGQIIALVGSTGNSTGPHLHFEVRINGIRINPAWFLEV